MKGGVTTVEEIPGRSAESVEEFIAGRSDLSPGDVQQRSAERFPDVRNFVDPNWEPSERPLVANYLVRDTLDATEARRGDRIPTFAALTARLYG